MAGLAAKTYAGPLFEVAEEQGLAEEIFEQLCVLQQAFEQTPDFVRLLDAPVLSAEEKRTLVRETFEKSVNGFVLNFLLVLCDNGRMMLFSEICEAFRALYNSSHDILEVTAVTAVPLAAGSEKRLVEKLQSVTGKKILLTKKVDASLLGGVKLYAGEKEMDGSVKTKLEGIRQGIRRTILDAPE